MAHKVWLRGLGKPPKNAIDHFTIPSRQTMITPELVKKYGLAPALDRMARAIMKESNVACGKPVIGVCFEGLVFCLQLGAYPDQNKSGAARQAAP